MVYSGIYRIPITTEYYHELSTVARRDYRMWHD
jgi:hypothetical protein